MNAETLSVGAELKAAREAQGLTLEQAATRLRLMNRQIGAMEENDYAVLGQPVFARGFVRNYARMLGLDADAMVARLGEAGLEPPQKIENLPLAPHKSLLSSPWVLVALALLVALIGVPLALYFWLNSGEEPPLAAPAKAMPATAAAPVVPAKAMPQPAPAATPVEAHGPAAPPPVPADAVTVTPISPAAPNPGPANDSQAEGGAPTVRSIIKLDFDENAWVEINEDGGRVLFHKMGAAGSSVTLSGTPPFSLVIGNAAHVRMTYNGRPLDLTPYIDVKVARFNLEQ